MIYRNLNPRGSRLTGHLRSPWTTETVQASIYLFSINGPDRQHLSAASRGGQKPKKHRESFFGTRHPSPGIFNYSLPGEPKQRDSDGSLRGHAPLCLPRTSNCFGLVRVCHYGPTEIACLCMQLHGCTPTSICTRLSTLVHRRNQNYK